MYGFGGVCLSEVMISISELSVVDLVGGWVVGLGEIGPEDPNFKIKTWALGF